MVTLKSRLSASTVRLIKCFGRYELIKSDIDRIESMEGKRMAIDSSIWLYQFQATMRDKDGRVLVNAHVLGESPSHITSFLSDKTGFLRRINKLLFHGIKPVFVFDGGAPVLKRNTIVCALDSPDRFRVY